PRDVRQAEANARGDRLAGALDRTAGLSAAAAEAKGRRQLPGDEAELRTRARHASLVVAAARRRPARGADPPAARGSPPVPGGRGRGLRRRLRIPGAPGRPAP